MRIAGIIAEYNPFHTGHAWHIAETRRMTSCDYVVACMAGHFTQRGEPAMFSKWARARMALSCGADAVVELPALFAVRTADAFARGGVTILGGIGCDFLSFGSETADMQLIRAMAGLRASEPQAVSDAIRAKLAEGMSHARARGEAIADYLDVEFETVNRPNFILASEYARSIEALYPRMEPVAIPRAGDYHDEALADFASASAIRTAFSRGDVKRAMAYIPEKARQYGAPDAMHAMDDLLMYKLRGMSEAEMARLPDISEGLEHRLYKLSRSVSGREPLLEALKCRRYTRARLSRLLTHALLEMDDALVERHPVPEYARLIGVRSGAEPLLAEMERRARVTIAASARMIRDDEVFQLECRATDIWALLHDEPEERLPGRELTERFVKV